MFVRHLHVPTGGNVVGTAAGIQKDPVLGSILQSFQHVPFFTHGN